MSIINTTISQHAKRWLNDGYLFID
ncbi:TPA: 3'-5' exonuclease, partial [Klebsiella pneumoniae]|nr:3'-5' exonuclease [Klebsiella pneumoniae]